MITKEREPLLSDDEIERYAMMYTIPTRYEAERALKYAKAIYEAARAKDAALIQQLVDALKQTRFLASCEYGDEEPAVIESKAAIAAAASAGFTPSEP